MDGGGHGHPHVGDALHSRYDLSVVRWSRFRQGIESMPGSHVRQPQTRGLVRPARTNRAFDAGQLQFWHGLGIKCVQPTPAAGGSHPTVLPCELSSPDTGSSCNTARQAVTRVEN